MGDAAFDAKEVVILRDLAERTARRAGKYLRNRFGDAGKVGHKASAIDLVTEADRQAEEIAIAAIRRERPGDEFLAEEGGGEGGKGGNGSGARVRWIIDPLDGTTNYARAFPIFAVSVAAEIGGELAAGAVHVPMLDELFTAVRGGGATVNGRRIHVSQVADLEGSFLATGFPYDIRDNPDNNLDHFARFSLRALAIRRAGAAAVDLCYLACGRFDGFWELRLKPWDLAAGMLIIREAGGRVTDLEGNSYRFGAPGVCASNGLIHEAMLAVIGAVPSSG